MIKVSRKLFLFAFASLISYQSFAVDVYQESYADTISDPFYGGVSLGLSFVEPETNSVALSLSQDGDSAFKLFAGYEFDKSWKAEAFWADLGDAEISSTSLGLTTPLGLIGYKAYGLGPVYSYQLNNDWDAFVKTGLGRLNTEAKNIAINSVESSFVYFGLGAEWKFKKKWKLKGEYEYFDKDAQLLSFGLSRSFGSNNAKRIAILENQVLNEFEMYPQLYRQTTNLEKQSLCENMSIAMEGVVFEKGSVQLNKDSRESLIALADRLKALPSDIEFEVRGYADADGSHMYNYTLSVARAQQVRDFLAEQGIALSRMEALGYGEWKPAKKKNNDGKILSDRRTEIALIGVERYVQDDRDCQ